MFAAIAREVAQALDLPLVEMCRNEADGTATVIGATGEHPFQPGTNWPLDGPSLTALVRHTERPARVDDYADVSGGSATPPARRASIPAWEPRSSWMAGCGEWFQLGVGPQSGCRPMPRPGSASSRRALRPRSEYPGGKSCTGSRTNNRRCGGLPRWWRGARSRPSCSMRSVKRPAGLVEVSSVLEVASINVLVRRTMAPGRADSYEGAPGKLAALLRKCGVASEVGAPVVVDGRVWGALIAGTDNRSWPFERPVAGVTAGSTIARIQRLKSSAFLANPPNAQRVPPMVGSVIAAAAA